MIAGSLADLRVLELHADLARYTGYLLAEAGADVLKVTVSGGVGGGRYGEHAPLLPTGEAAPDVYFDAGKRMASVDVGTRDGAAFLQALVAGADVVLTSLPGAISRLLGLEPEAVRKAHPHLVYLAVTPFGLTGPLADAPATDLTVLAAGGFLSLAGNDRGEPVRPFGDQSAMMAGLHAWVAVLVALLARDATGEGALVDVSAQQAVVHSLENAIQYYDLEGVVRRPRGSSPMEAGTGIYPCSDGYVYMVGGMAGAALGWSRLAAWMTSHGGEFDVLGDEQWADSAHRATPAAMETFARLWSQFAGDRTRDMLYAEGQTFGVSICPLLTPSELPDNPQLAARGFFTPMVTDRGDNVLLPGSPIRTDAAGPGRSAASACAFVTDLSDWAACGEDQVKALLAVGAVGL